MQRTTAFNAIPEQDIKADTHKKKEFEHKRPPKINEKGATQRSDEKGGSPSDIMLQFRVTKSTSMKIKG